MSKTLETKFEARSNFFYSSYIKTETKVFNDNADILLTIRRAGNVKNEKAKEMKRKTLLGSVSTCMFSVILPGSKTTNWNKDIWWNQCWNPPSCHQKLIVLFKNSFGWRQSYNLTDPLPALFTLSAICFFAMYCRTPFFPDWKGKRLVFILC